MVLDLEAPKRGVLLVAACLASACGAGGGPPVPVERPLRVVMSGPLRTLDPHIPFDDVSSAVIGNVFESLVHFDRSLSLSSGLARRWINPDERTWRFFLDPQARFSDGSALTAADVRFSIERLRALPDSELLSFTRLVTGVEVVDELTLDLHTERPVAILNDLAFIPIVSERHVRKVGDGVAQEPLGTGPYKLLAWEPGRRVRLGVNPYHAPRPHIAEVELRLREGAGMLEEVRAARPDLVLLPDTRTREALERQPTPELRLVSASGLYVFYLGFNLRLQLPGERRPNPLADPRVRGALAHATDRDAIVRDVLNGHGRPAAQLVVPEVFGYDAGIEPHGYDPGLARKLLGAAGQPQLEVSILSPMEGSQRLERLLAEQWARAGVRTSIVTRPLAEVETLLASGSFSATIQGWGCTSADASELLSFLLHRRDPEHGYGRANHFGFRNAELDRLAVENLGVFDPKQRLALLQRALRLAAAEGPYLPLYSQNEVYAVGQAVEWSPRVDGEFRLEDVTWRAARPESR